MRSGPFTFTICYFNEVRSLIQLVILTATIISSTHVHKKVFNTKSGTGTFIKGKDELPNYLIAFASHLDNPDEGTFYARIKDWKAGLNCIFPFAKESPSRG